MQLRRFVFGSAYAALASLAASPALAGPIPTVCEPSVCGWSISVNGAVVQQGGFAIDAEGNISALGNPNWSDGAGSGASITGLSGNVDPEIVFGLGATNATNGTLTYSFAFSLPLGGFPVPISTYAELGTTLTSPTGLSAFLFPTSGVGKIVDSQDIRLSPFQSVDKGVDIGDAKTGAAGTTSLYFESASGSIVSGGPFDLMSVIVSFGLTDPGGAGAAGVGMSGKVSQLALVPEPSTRLLLGAGLAGLARSRRRRDS
jgi:PEP-CTERM motif